MSAATLLLGNHSNSSGNATGCSAPVPMSSVGVGIGLWFVSCTVPVFLPQFLAIHRARSSAGLSISTAIVTVLLGVVNTSADVLIKWDQLQQCGVVGWRCVYDLLDGLNIALLTCCVWLQLLQMVWYPPNNGSGTRAVAAAALCTPIVALGSAVGVSLVAPCSDTSLTLAQALASAGALFALVQYAPQVLETYRCKSAGSLSIASYVLQAIGAVGVVIQMSILTGDPYTVWGPWAVSGAVQFLVAMMAVYYDYSPCARQTRALRLEPQPARDEGAGGEGVACVLPTQPKAPLLQHPGPS